MLRIIAICGLLLSLSACASVSRSLSSSQVTDGPPSFHVDVMQIPDAVPKPEPLSTTGNPLSYEVFGKTYYTLQEADDYSAQGIASWYGSKFHKRRTSSGEPYDMLAMTAAHRSLPLPSYVRVTNLLNGKSIVVKVNDRGPFHHNRIIDLSYAAAKKLDILDKGTGMVQVDVIPILRHDINDPNNGLFLQVGAFSSLENAQLIVTKIEGIVTEPVQLVPHDSLELHVVRIGPLANILARTKIESKLLAMGIL